MENGRIREADWWQTHRESDDEEDEYDELSVSSAAEDTTTMNSSSNTAAPKQQRKFVNQGYTLWSQGRAAWKQAKSPEACRRRTTSIPESFKSELVKCLGDRRQFELSQRIPLKTMIEAYQVVWNADPNE